MPVFAFTVGSFGDIITMVVFIVQIAFLFSYSTEYNREYELLDEEVKTFTDTLDATRRETQFSALDYTSKDVLGRTVGIGDKVLAEIKEKIAGDHERNDGPFWWALRLRRALWWIVFGRKEVEHCRSRLRDQQTSMTAMIQALNSSSVYETRHIASYTQATQADVAGLVKSSATTYDGVLIIQRLLQHKIHNIADPVDPRSTVFLVDLLGDTNHVPINFFDSKEILNKYLDLFFAAKAGGDFVQRRSYMLTFESEVITWNGFPRFRNESGSIQPGTTIYMSASIVYDDTGDHDSQYNECPLCLTLNRGTWKKDVYLKIMKCCVIGFTNHGHVNPSEKPGQDKDRLQHELRERLRFVRRVFVLPDIKLEIVGRSDSLRKSLNDA